MTVPVAVAFSIQIASRVMVSEAEIDTVTAVAPSLLPSDYLPGRFLFLADGQAPISIEDDLESLVVQFLEAIPVLVGGETVELYFSDAPGTVAIAVQDTTIQISGDFAGPFEAPAAELLRAIFECCQRFIAFARRDLEGNRDVQTRINQLDTWVDTARTALQVR